MSKTLDNLLASSCAITDIEQIKDIVETFYNTKIHVIKPPKSPSIYQYVFKELTEGFSLAREESERDLNIGFLIYLLHQARYNDFFSFEEEGEDIDFIGYPITLTCAFAKSLIYESGKIPAVEAFLNISLYAYLDAMKTYCPSIKGIEKELSEEFKRFMPGIEIVLPQKPDSTTTLGDVFKEALKIAGRQYNPGTIALTTYFETIMNASVFISDLLVELPYIAFDIEYFFNGECEPV